MPCKDSVRVLMTGVNIKHSLLLKPTGSEVAEYVSSSSIHSLHL